MITQILVLDNDERVVAVLANELPGTCPITAARRLQQAQEGGSYIDKLTVTVPGNHPDAVHVKAGNYLLYQDSDGVWNEYRIVTPERTDAVTSTITATAEHASYELASEPIYDLRPTNKTAGQAATSVLSGTRWQLGTAADLGSNSLRIYYTSVLAGLVAIAARWGGELQFRVTVSGGEITGRYVDILARRGQDTGKRFEIGKDLTSVKQTIDMKELCTALIGRGKGVELDQGEESDPTYGRRISLGDVAWSVAAGDPVDKPMGQEWIGDEAARLAYGPGGRHIYGHAIFEDCTSLLDLPWLTFFELQARKTPRVTYALTAICLEEATGLDHEKVRLGDGVYAINTVPTPAIVGDARVITLDRNLLDDRDIKVELGNFVPTMAGAMTKLKQRQELLQSHAGVWDETAGVVEQHSTTIQQTAEEILLKADDSRVDGLETRISSAEFALTPAQIKMTVGEIGANNMISNSGQFADTTYWLVSKDADTTITSGPVRLITTDAAVAAGTLPVIDLKVNVFSGGWCNLINTSFQGKRFIAGRKYTISGRFYTNAALNNPNIAISDTNGTNIVLPTTALPGGTGWRNFSVTFAAASVGNAPTLIFWARASGAQLSIEEVKLEAGETATAWSMSAEEAATRISSAEASLTVQADLIEARATKTYVDAADSGLNAAAAAAQTAASNAASAAATANATLADIASDSKLTPTEKRVVRKEWDIIAAEKDPMLAQADKFTNTVEKAAYLSAFQALANYLNAGVTWTTGVPSWITDANLSITTNFTGATFRTRFKAYYDARTTLLNVLAYQAQQRADAAYSHVDEAILAIEPDLIAAKVGQVGIGNANMIRNGRGDFGVDFWGTSNGTRALSNSSVLGRQVLRVVATAANGSMTQTVSGLIVGNWYTISARVSKDTGATQARILTKMKNSADADVWSTKVTKNTNGWEIVSASFQAIAGPVSPTAAVDCTFYFNTVGEGYGSGWTDIKLEEGKIATAFCPHSSELKSTSMEMTDSRFKVRTQEILIELLDALNNVALSIDGTEKSLNTKSASGIMSMLGNAIMGKLAEDGFWVTSQSNWGWYLRNRFTKETANGMSITGEDLGSSKYGVNVRLGAPFDELGFIASDGTYIQKMYQDGHAKFPQKVMVGSAAVAPVSPLHVHMYDSTTGTTNGVTIQQGSLDGDAQLQFILDYGSRRFVVGLDQSDGQKFKIARAAGFANTCMTIDPDNGNAWFVGNVSVASLTDRTPWPEDHMDALEELRWVRGDGKGGIDHGSLPKFARYQRVLSPGQRHKAVIDGEIVEIVDKQDIVEEGRDICALSSLLTIAVQQLDRRTRKLAEKDAKIADLTARLERLEALQLPLATEEGVMPA